MSETKQTLKFLEDQGMALPSPRKEYLWKGPEVDGITFSLLSRFIVDRERFRILVVEGLKPIPKFKPTIDYGSMWHMCEETWAGLSSKMLPPWDKFYQTKLIPYCKRLCEIYPTQIADVTHWFEVCRLQFPIYVNYWMHHPDQRTYEPVEQEKVFNVPYELPSGRIVHLKGKRDSVGKMSDGYWLRENKTKGDIREDRLERQLGFDLQTMMYLTALQFDKEAAKNVVSGVQYNVIRRPLSGGKHSIRLNKGETQLHFYQRLGGLMQEDPSFFFMRMLVQVSQKDIERFRNECLDPILESLCDWWHFITHVIEPFERPERGMHWRMPFGVYDPLQAAGETELDAYLEDGSEVGLRRAETLFPELEDL